jgi:beta-lactamase regulating signal transducer with metallopeptidase domain
MHTDLHHIMTAIAFALLHSLWQVSLLGLLAACSFKWMQGAAASQRHTVGMVWMLAMVLAPLSTFDASGQAGGNSAGAVPSWTDWVLPGITFVWLAGVAAMLALRWGGWRVLQGVDGHGRSTLPAEWEGRVERLRASFGIARTVAVRVGTHIASPFTAYVLRPVVWLPLGLLTRLPAEQVEALIAHELAHVRRLDWIWNLVQHGIESALFYHPAMWWLSARIREERELACDALAAQVCGDPVVLAEALLRLQRERARPQARPQSGRRGHGLGFGLSALGGVLHRRVAHLVQERHERPVARHRSAAGLMLVAACLCCALAAAVRTPHALLINMQVDESMDGPLRPGHYREFTADYLFDGQRYYRVDVDAQGKRSERYREDGASKPVDDDVRSWAAAMAAMHTRTPAAPGG